MIVAPFFIPVTTASCGHCDVPLKRPRPLEFVVHPNYIIIYRVSITAMEIVSVIHSLERGDQAGRTGGEQGRVIGQHQRANPAGTVGGHCRAQLVPGEHPAKHHARPLPAEMVPTSLTVGGTVAIQSKP